MDAAVGAVTAPAGEDPLRAGYDVVVVGGGAAGLSAALALGRFRRSVLVIDAGAPRNAPASHLHNYLGHEGTPPGELLAIGRGEVARYGVRVITATVTSAERAEVEPADGAGRFVVALGDGRSVRARRLLVTTGLVDELPDLPGVARRWGRDVLHCPYCHGHEVADQAIGILASGAAGVHTALMWRQLSSDVTLFLNGVGDPAPEQWDQLAAREVAVVDGPVAALEVTGDRLSGVRLVDGRVFPRQAVVITTRLVARSHVLATLGVDPAEAQIGGQTIGTRIPTDPAGAPGATTVPGVYVAGNITDVLAQVVGSAAAGLGAGASINMDLIADDTARAVTTRAARTLTAGSTAPASEGPFSAAMEAEVSQRVLGERRHGVTVPAP